jgi:glutathione synthase/RimK-type ligase-like ATP-grasp enzyme
MADVAARKRVLLTVNPLLVRGKRMMTQRSLVTALDRHADLLLATAGDYDFAHGLVRAYRRTRGGKFEEVGMIPPSADLWIVYSDGYYLDHRARGFCRRRDFFLAQADFHQRQLDAGNVGRVVNEPAVETRTLKSWLATLNSAKYRTLPTRLLPSIEQVSAFRESEGAIVAKPDWGGGGTGAHRLLDENDVRSFERKLARDGSDLSDYCFQPYRPGDEKRMWFAGGRFVAGRKCRGRKTPWSDRTADYDVCPYASPEVEGFAADLEAAERLAAVSGLDVGSIDFIGDSINEINGCGTIFTEYKYWQRIVDARPALVKYFVDLLPTL